MRRNAPSGVSAGKKENALRYLIAVLLAIALTALVRPEPPALTKQVVHNVPSVKTAHKPHVKKAVQHQPVKRVAKPQPKPTTPIYPASCSAYEPILAQYQWNVHMAMAIMQAESGCNPYAVSNASINYDGCPDYGLMQIHCDDVLNPNQNIATAYHKYQSQGWNAWSTYKSGAVWRYY